MTLALVAAARPGAALAPVGAQAWATFGLLGRSRHPWSRLQVLTVAEAAWAVAALGLARLLLGPVAATLARRRESIHLAVLER